MLVSNNIRFTGESMISALYIAGGILVIGLLLCGIRQRTKRINHLDMLEREALIRHEFGDEALSNIKSKREFEFFLRR